MRNSRNNSWRNREPRTRYSGNQRSRYAEAYRRYDERDDNNYGTRGRTNRQSQYGYSDPYRDNERNYTRNQGGGLYGVTGKYGSEYRGGRYDYRSSLYDNWARDTRPEGGHGRGEYQGDQYDPGYSRHSDRQGRRGHGSINYNDGGDTYEYYDSEDYENYDYDDQDRYDSRYDPRYPH